MKGLEKMRNDQRVVEAVALDGHSDGGWGNGPYREYRHDPFSPSVRVVGRRYVCLDPMGRGGSINGPADVDCWAEVIVAPLDAIRGATNVRVCRYPGDTEYYEMSPA